jgi:aspartyl aminopeptidase
MTATVHDLLAFLDGSPSPRHAVASAVDRLVGFTELAETDTWTDIPDAGYVRRGGSLIAWRRPGDRPASGFRIIGAHTDSPCLRVKPNPDETVLGWSQLGVEVYGGILNNSWLDRDLGVAGVVVGADGGTRLVAVGEPIARVPQLAVHLDREVNAAGLRLDPQQHLTPVWGTGTSSEGDFAAWIGEHAGLDGPAAWWELCLYDVQPATLLGHDRSLLASGRIDNLVSCWAAVEALRETDDRDGGGTSGGERSTGADVALIVLNDHEEVGSASATGAAGPFLEHVLGRLAATLDGGADALPAALARSSCVSVDNAHAVHPNYPDRHEPQHQPMVNAGPAIKVNASQRYATSPETAQWFQRCCQAAGVPWQVFVSRNNMPCGSTIGPVTSTRLGIATVDVGVAQLSMHSARELCGADDPAHLVAALGCYLSARA